MADLDRFIEKTGGLHDASAQKIVWQPEIGLLRIEIEDVYSNFEGMPEHMGPCPGFLEFVGVESLSIELSTDRRQLMIYEFSTESAETGRDKFSFRFWPEGKLTGAFSSVKVSGLRK